MRRRQVVGGFGAALPFDCGIPCFQTQVNAVMEAYDEVMKTGALSSKKAAALKTVADRLPKPSLLEVDDDM